MAIDLLFLLISVPCIFLHTDSVSIYIQGGLPGAQKFSSTKKLVDLLKKQAKSNKPYGAICASPAHVLEPHGLLEVISFAAFISFNPYSWFRTKNMNTEMWSQEFVFQLKSKTCSCKVEKIFFFLDEVL